MSPCASAGNCCSVLVGCFSLVLHSGVFKGKIRGSITSFLKIL